MWISREQFESLQQNLNAYKQWNEAQSTRIEALAKIVDFTIDLAGYEEKKKQLPTSNYVLENGIFVLKPQTRNETKTEFVERLMAEKEENDRLRKLAEDVAAGNKLLKEK